MWQWIGSPLVQIMACCIVGAKPLSELMLEYCPLDLKEQTSVKLESKYKTFHSRKWIWNCHLQNGRYFVQRRWVNTKNISVFRECALNNNSLYGYLIKHDFISNKWWTMRRVAWQPLRQWSTRYPLIWSNYAAHLSIRHPKMGVWSSNESYWLNLKGTRIVALVISFRVICPIV